MMQKQITTRRRFIEESSKLAGAMALARCALGSAGGWQIGCYTRPWDQFDYRVALDGIAEAGYKSAGLMTHKGKTWVIITVDTTPEESAAIGEEMRKRGLAAVSIYGGDFRWRNRWKPGWRD